MNRNLLIFFCLFLLITVNCQKSEFEPKDLESLEIRDIEIGSKNSKIVYAGSDLHIEGLIEAKHGLDQVKVEITPQVSGYGFAFDRTYKEGFNGLKEAMFHQHILIPKGIKPGLHNFLFILKDLKGNTKIVRDTLKIENNPNLPEFNNVKFRIDGSIVKVEATILAKLKIDRIELEIQSSVWNKTVIYNHNQIKGVTSYNFSEGIDMTNAPSAHYHVNCTVYDQQNNKITRSFHFDK
ncbi:DUF4625 domain-containing protein [Sphingobacterium lactis]|uniref:DUF4625 domain-containing protein n=1 Tax=Sphingobacterium lactis TaxID=797291 RepID=UPI003F7EB90A